MLQSSKIKLNTNYPVSYTERNLSLPLSLSLSLRLTIKEIKLSILFIILCLSILIVLFSVILITPPFQFFNSLKNYKRKEHVCWIFDPFVYESCNCTITNLWDEKERRGKNLKISRISRERNLEGGIAFARRGR